MAVASDSGHHMVAFVSVFGDEIGADDCGEGFGCVRRVV
jgi:hypothetical protein